MLPELSTTKTNLRPEDRIPKNVAAPGAVTAKRESGTLLSARSSPGFRTPSLTATSLTGDPVDEGELSYSASAPASPINEESAAVSGLCASSTSPTCTGVADLS